MIGSLDLVSCLLTHTFLAWIYVQIVSEMDRSIFMTVLELGLSAEMGSTDGNHDAACRNLQ